MILTVRRVGSVVSVSSDVSVDPNLLAMVASSRLVMAQLGQRPLAKFRAGYASSLHADQTSGPTHSFEVGDEVL